MEYCKLVLNITSVT